MLEPLVLRIVTSLYEARHCQVRLTFAEVPAARASAGSRVRRLGCRSIDGSRARSQPGCHHRLRSARRSSPSGNRPAPPRNSPSRQSPLGTRPIAARCGASSLFMKDDGLNPDRHVPHRLHMSASPGPTPQSLVPLSASTCRRSTIWASRSDAKKRISCHLQPRRSVLISAMEYLPWYTVAAPARLSHHPV